MRTRSRWALPFLAALALALALLGSAPRTVVTDAGHAAVGVEQLALPASAVLRHEHPGAPDLLAVLAVPALQLGLRRTSVSGPEKTDLRSRRRRSSSNPRGPPYCS